MITAYVEEDGRLFGRPLKVGKPLPDGLRWLDVEKPGPEERAWLERQLAVPLPVREQMEEIEASSRAYRRDGQICLTVHLPEQTDVGHFELVPVSFLLTQGLLVDQRYRDVTVLAHFAAGRRLPESGSAEAILLELFERAVDRIADLFEAVGERVERLSERIFLSRLGDGKKKQLRSLLHQVGRAGDQTARLRESLVSFELVLAFLSQTVGFANAAGPEGRLATLERDVASLAGYAGFVHGKITFLLDALLGLINIEQNDIIKIFSVLAVLFLPPTLIASIYGMNFRNMPELNWEIGYPLALLAMVLSAILPYAWFRRKGWF